MISKSQKTFLGLGVGVLLLTVGGYTLAQTSATQVSACAKNNGSMYLIGPSFSRQTCLSGDVQIDWPTLAGTPKQLHLYDGNNIDLGWIVSASGQGSPSNAFTVYVPSQGLFVDYGLDGLNVSANIGGGSGTVYFNGPNCVGTPLLNASNQGAGNYSSPNTLFGFDGYLYKKNISVTTTTTVFSARVGGSCQNLENPEEIEALSLVVYPTPPIVLNPVWPIRVVETQF